MNSFRSILLAMIVALLVTSCATHPPPLKTVADRLVQFGPSARARLTPLFQTANLNYPPQRVVFAAFKQERMLEVYAADATNGFQWVASFPILGASGTLGPKLREGDRQVPEGIYRIEELNPNSRHEIALKVGFPNTFDLAHAAAEGRTNPGSDIMIHGSNTSIGCLAMGDEVAADLFVLVADVGIENVEVIISPVDFRAGKTVPPGDNQPVWVGELYESIRNQLAELPAKTL